MMARWADTPGNKTRQMWSDTPGNKTKQTWSDTPGNNISDIMCHPTIRDKVLTLTITSAI